MPEAQAQQFLDQLEQRAEVVEQLRDRLRNLELVNALLPQLIDASEELERRVEASAVEN